MHHQRLDDYRRNKLDEMTFSKMQEEMQAETVSSEELVLMYMENISLRNKDLNAILEINPDALHIAQSLDFELQRKGLKSPLHGIPIVVKDNIETADKMHTSAGSLALENHYALNDAFLIEKLRKAGAVILGKTNMTEWANFMTDKMKNGYSSRGGQVKNPYGAFDVGGSSSGASSATAANLTAAAIGTETSGSIINPAVQNSLVGLKPTVGMISRRGIIPLSHSQDTAGPLARTVEDAVKVFSVLVGVDPEDPITRLSSDFEGYDWSVHLKKDGLKNVRLAVTPELFKEIPDEQIVLFEQAKAQLRECGAEIIEGVDLGANQEDLGFAVLLHEFKVNLNAYLAKTSPSNPIRSLDDVIAFNNENADQMLKFGQELFEQANRLNGLLTEREYVEALERNRFLAADQGITATLKEVGADAIIMPQDFGCNVGAAAGFPAITVPFGYSETHEPFGVTFSGRPFSEPKLIEYAYAFEQAVKGRKNPYEKG